jgi:DNA-binding response OmpR family regulator
MTSRKYTAQLNQIVHSPVDNLMPLILIVEDDEDSRQMLKFLLEMWKFRVIEAADGLEAFTIAENLRPDLILMDVKLPNSDGFEATRRIRESEHINLTPIIFLTGCAEEIYRLAAGTAGADEYLVKPLDFPLLENTLEKYVSRQPAYSRENP